MTGILAGTCGYSGNFNSPSNAAIFWANQDLLFTMYSAEFSMVNCFTQNLVKTSYWLLFYSAEFSFVLVSSLNFLTIVSSIWFFTLNLLMTSPDSAEFSRVMCYMRTSVKTSSW